MLVKGKTLRVLSIDELWMYNSRSVETPASHNTTNISQDISTNTMNWLSKCFRVNTRFGDFALCAALHYSFWSMPCTNQKSTPPKIESYIMHIQPYNLCDVKRHRWVTLDLVFSSGTHRRPKNALLVLAKHSAKRAVWGHTVKQMVGSEQAGWRKRS